MEAVMGVGAATPAPSFTYREQNGGTQGFPQQTLSFSDAMAPIPSSTTITVMRITCLISSSPWELSWLPASILIPWVGKCLAELLLLYTAITRRVRYLWLMAGYTFSTTLGLMILLERKWKHYIAADNAVSVSAGAVMLVVLLALVQLLRKGRREYGAITLTFVLLCASQVVLGFVQHRLVYTTYNTLSFSSWIGFVLWLSWQSWLMPLDSLSPKSVAALMARDVLD